ncbi:hypothetical protein [Streptomyces sp. NBC_01304]|uniref:hypothetical protein n=1 Tax=Streptomyces sp. NBC_01304 TaxID=2903818 RepID=UPI002E114C78|nr:hypothetical protein OG430_17750 [Streptomyces sp. NBC_01304]
MTVRGWGVAALAVGAALVLGACGAKGESDSRADGVRELPLDRYELSAKEYRRATEAQARLAQRCMVDLGFADFPRHPKEPKSREPGRALVAIGWSALGGQDLEHARRWGYGWNEKKGLTPKPDGRRMTEEEYAAYNAGPGIRELPADGESGGRAVPEVGCNQQAAQRIYRGIEAGKRPWTYTRERTAALEKQATGDPRMREAFRTWSQCVQDKGFKRYARPVKAAQDPAWRPKYSNNTTHGKRELGTAVADIECKREHGTADVWSTVVAELQRADLKRHKSQYEAAKREHDKVRARVRAALGEAGEAG